jgi:site-specific recombinase XerC
MVRPVGRPMARKAISLEDLREEFLAHCEARNLSGRTVEWYDDRTRRFTDWCATQGIDSPLDLHWSNLERFVLHCRRQGFAPNTVHGYAQVLKTLCRQGHRMGYIPEDITTHFEMPRVPATIIPTFSDEQLQALLAVPDRRTWVGTRDRAILLVLLDTLIRVSELVGLDAEDVDLDEAVIRVTGKGRKERRVPFAMAAGQALRRYRHVVQDLRPGDPFFITRYRRPDQQVGGSHDGCELWSSGRHRRGTLLTAHPPPHGSETVHPGRRRRLHPPEAAGSHDAGDGAPVRGARRCGHQGPASALQPS